MIVDPDPTCKFINTEGTANHPVYLYECPCGIVNAIDDLDYPFDELICWQCKAHSLCEYDQLDEIIKEFTSKSWDCVIGKPRKSVRDAMKRASKGVP